MVFKRLDTILQRVIDDARKAELLTTRSTISGMGPTRSEGKAPDPEARPVREEIDQKTSATRTREEPSPDPKARPVLRVIDGGKCLLARPKASEPPLRASRHLQLV